MSQQPPDWGNSEPHAQQPSAQGSPPLTPYGYSYPPNQMGGVYPQPGYGHAGSFPRFTHENVPAPSWLRAIRAGMITYLCYIGALLAFMLVAIISVFALPTDSYHFSLLGLQFIASFILILYFIALKKITTPEPGIEESPGHNHAKYALIAMYVLIGFTVCFMAFNSYFALTNSVESVMQDSSLNTMSINPMMNELEAKGNYASTLRSQIPYYLLEFLTTLGGHVVFLFLTMYLIWLCKRLRLNAMKTQVSIAFFGFLCCAILILPFQILQSAMATADPSQMVIINLIAFIPLLCFFGFAIYMLVIFIVLIFQLGKVLEEVSRIGLQPMQSTTAYQPE